MRITVSTVNLLNSAAAHKIAARQRTGLSTLHTPPLAVTQRPLCSLARERIFTKQALQSPGHAHSSHVTLGTDYRHYTAAMRSRLLETHADYSRLAPSGQR